MVDDLYDKRKRKGGRRTLTALNLEIPDMRDTTPTAPTTTPTTAPTTTSHGHHTHIYSVMSTEDRIELELWKKEQRMLSLVLDALRVLRS